jgi:hypothetical protein
MATKFRVSILDNTEREPASSINVIVDPALPANGVPGGDQDSLLAALTALTIGAVGESSMNEKIVHEIGTTVRPADTLAQNEKRFVVNFTDTVLNVKGSFSIPCADLTLLPTGSENLDITSGAGQTLANLLNSHGRSKFGNAISVTGISFKSV